MMIYMFGFNGFHQISSRCDDHLDISELLELEKASDFALSWNKLCYITGFQLCIRGFPEVKRLSEDSFVKVRCSDRHLVAVTKNGLGKIYAVVTDGLQQRHTVNVGGRKIVDCAAGDIFAAFICTDGKAILTELGSMTQSLLPIANKITSIACGKEHAVLLNELGNVYTLGCGSRGQLGHGCLESEESPRIIDCLEGLSVQSIAAGGWHSAAITNSGDLYTWGWNESGQLGFPSKNHHADKEAQDEVLVQAIPKCVVFSEEICASAVSCGSRHTLVLTDNGKLWAFGSNLYSQLGLDTLTVFDTPSPVKYFESHHLAVSQICAGGWTSLVIAQRR